MNETIKTIINSKSVYNDIDNVCKNAVKDFLNLKMELIENDVYQTPESYIALRFSGDIGGLFYLTFNNNSLMKKIAEKMLGKKITDENKIKSACKEMCNIIAGNVSTYFEKENIDIMLDSNVVFIPFNPKSSKKENTIFFKYKVNNEDIIQIIILFR